MRLRPHEAALAALRTPDLPNGVEEATPFSRDTAVRYLSMFTGQEFGDDVVAWEKWFANHDSTEYIERCYSELEAKVSRQGKASQ
jgi:hypothetical protein